MITARSALSILEFLHDKHEWRDSSERKFEEVKAFLRHHIELEEEEAARARPTEHVMFLATTIARFGLSVEEAIEAEKACRDFQLYGFAPSRQEAVDLAVEQAAKYVSGRQGHVTILITGVYRFTSYCPFTEPKAVKIEEGKATAWPMIQRDGRWEFNWIRCIRDVIYKGESDVSQESDGEANAGRDPQAMEDRGPEVRNS